MFFELLKFFINKNQILVINGQIWSCNFDTNTLLTQQCRGSTSVSNPTWGLVEHEAVPGSAPAFTVTDVSSINNSTQGSADVCTIPFFVSTVEYDFCQMISATVFTCLTPSGTRNCNRGNFLRIRGASNGAAFSGTLTLINPIILPVAGAYRMVVYTFFHCPYAACPTSNDLIQVAISEDGSTNYDKK